MYGPNDVDERFVLGLLTVVGAKFIAPVSESDSVSSVRIGWQSGRNEFGPYDAAFSRFA